MVDKKAVEDFKVFAEGVKRLKELEKELNALDTRKFKNEAQNIRRKLKSVHAIPQIERELNELKARISGVDIDFLKSKLDFEQTRRIGEIERKSQELERQLFAAKKGILNEQEKVTISDLPLLKNRVNYLRELIGKEDSELRKEMEGVRREKIRKQLTDDEVRDVNSIPNLRGKIAYLSKLLEIDEEKLKKFDYLKDRVEFALTEARKKELSDNEKQDIDAIPHLKGRLSYLRELIGKEDSELRKEIEKAKREKVRKQLSDEEVKNVESIPHLGGKIEYLRGLLKRDESELKKIEEFFAKGQENFNLINKKIEKIPGLQGRITNLSNLLEEKSSEISKEAEEIDFLKHKLSYFKKILEEKEQQIQEELKKAQDPSLKKKLIAELNELENKIDNTKKELYDQFNKEISESKWMIQKQREELQEELRKLASASAKVMADDRDETVNKLVSELTKINQKIEGSKSELNEQIARNIGDLRRKLNELEKVQKMDEGKAALSEQLDSKFNYLKEKLEYLERQQKRDELRVGNHVAGIGIEPFVSRSKALGITPKYLQKIESLENLNEPKKIKEINPLVESKKHEPKIKFRAGEEIPELPPMPLTAEELQTFMPPISRDNFASDIEFRVNVPKRRQEEEQEKELDIYELKKEIVSQKPKFSITAKQEKSIILEEPKNKKPIKRKVPNRKFLEQEKFFRFTNNLSELKNLSENYEGLFEDVKELKNFNKNSAEKLLEDSHSVRNNLLKIHSKLLAGVRAD